VVFQLGESLITDSIQALMELVKNSYDADASFCRVSISTMPAPDESPFKGAIGTISVEDDGVGMTLDTIRSGWLTISNSAKRQTKRKKETTAKGRTPLGDKGLGRLGTQRLGQNLEMITRTADSLVEQRVWFSWKQFSDQHVLSDVSVKREEKPPTFRKGTRLVVSELRDVSTWTEEVNELETRLSSMISPYEEARDFSVFASLNGTDLELLSISAKLRETAQLRYSLDFDGSSLTVTGHARLNYIRPESAATADEKAEFKTLIEDDQGEAFFEFLKAKKQAEGYQLSRSVLPGWYVSFQTSIDLSSMDKAALVDGVCANPGPFKGVVDFFSLSGEAVSEAVSEGVEDQSIYTRTEEYRRTISRLSGIRVYRDGFGIPVPSDWLGLGKQRTKAKSYYTLKPQNTLGYIALTARDNGQLQEKTDREGFTDNPYYRNFADLLGKFIEFTGNAQQFLRRGYNDYRRAQVRKAANVAPETTPEELSKSVGTFLAKAASHKTSVQKSALRLTQAIRDADAVLDPNSEAGRSVTPEQLREHAAVLREQSSTAAEVMREAEGCLDAAAGRSSEGGVIGSQIAELREQIQQVYEIIGLGLTAEALSHEVNNVLMQLNDRTKVTGRMLRASGSKDARLFSYLEYVESSVAALRRQMIFLEPTLRYARERREVLDLAQVAKELQQHYTLHFIQMPIAVTVDQKRSKRPFRIKMNRGKLIQILDNLVINSEYWLKEAIRSGIASRGNITIEIEAPYIRVSDTGPGIDPAVEHTLFEPFISMKGKGRGRGLGLYVAQQLLRAEGCDIRLTGRRNAAGKHTEFEIDLTGVLTDE
jgi:signal transduction histidine kinase